MGRHDEALAEAKRGQQLDPVSPEANLFVGSVLVFSRQYDQAIEQLRSGLELDQNYCLAIIFWAGLTSKKEDCLRQSPSFSAHSSWKKTMPRIGQILDTLTRYPERRPRR